MAPVRAERLSILLRRPGADWAVAFLGAVVPTFFLALAVWRRNHAAFDGPYSNHSLLIVLGVWCGVFGWLGVKAWRRLWRSGRTPTEQMVYDRGVRGWGARMLVIMPLLMGILVWVITADPNAGLLILACVLMGFITGLPVFLWSGYILGSFAASNRFPAERNEPRDLPPPI